MARSLTVATEDQPSTNWLLTGFLLAAIGFLALGAVVAMLSAADEADAATVIEAPAVP